MEEKRNERKPYMFNKDEIGTIEWVMENIIEGVSIGYSESDCEDVEEVLKQIRLCEDK